MRTNRLLVFLSLTLILISSLFPQGKGTGRGKGRLTGSVTDVNGNPIANAKIDLIFRDNITKFNTSTNEKGQWAILGLGTGEYKIMIQADGYVPLTTIYLASQVNENKPLALKMEKAEKPILQEDMIKILDEGNRLYEEKNYDEAIGAFNQILEKFPDMYQVSFKIADALRKKGDVDKAIVLYEEVIKKAKEKEDISVAAQALGNIGGIYLDKKDMDKAQAYFQQSIEMNPQNEILAYNVAEISFNSSQVDTAIKYYEIAAKIKPDWTEPYMKLAYCYLNKVDNVNAAKYLKKVVELEPDSNNGQIAKDVLKSMTE